MPEASPVDVHVEIDTHLQDSEVSKILSRIEREWKREYESSDFDDTQHIQDFEAVLAALRIAEGRDRRAEEVQSGRTSQTYEASEIANLRKRLRRIDPGGKFGHAGSVVVDDGRYTTTTSDT